VIALAYRRRGVDGTQEEAAVALQGRWSIVSMSTWDEDYFNEEVPALIEFKAEGLGGFQFGLVSGEMDCRETTRGGELAVEWSWEGYDESSPATGRGWAVIEDGQLHGMIFIHLGDESEFVAKRG
jgi:hypothetical protein